MTSDMALGVTSGTACSFQKLCTLFTILMCFRVAKCLFRKDSPKAKSWQHEDASLMMFDYLIKDNGIEMKEKDKIFIRKLISGVAESEPCP
jgi:hypothetical protein